MDEKFMLWTIFISIVVATILIAYLVNRFFLRLIKKSSEELNNDPTNYKFLRRAIVVVIYMVGAGIAIYSTPSLRTLASSLLAGAGIMAIAVGFASQEALSNIIGGIFIVIFKPFRVHDQIKIRELKGVIEDITLRHTVIKDFENRRIIIPNAIISNEIIINADFGEERICKWIIISISYDSDIDLAKKIMEDEVLKHPLHIDYRTQEQIELGEPEVPVRVIQLGDSSVDLRAWAWASNWKDGFILGCDLMESIKKRFDKEGIEIPFPHRTLVYKNNNQSTAKFEL